jgi:hypothetical protein
MRPIMLLAGVILTCAACVPYTPAEPVFSQIATQPDPADPNCREYSAQVIIEGREQAVVGRACRQTDGSWRVVEGSPDQSIRYVTTYVPPPYAYYPAYDLWLWEPPIGLSLGASVVFVDRDHRFHHFRFAGRRDGLRFGGLHEGSRFEGMHHGFGRFGRGGMGRG